MDGNGRIELADVILALKIAAGLSPEAAITISADTDGDQKIGLPEAIYGFNNIQ